MSAPHDNLPNGTVTFLFTDIQGSTRLWERHPDAMRTALARHDALLRGSIEAHGGHVFKTVGDAFHAAFARPGEALGAALQAQTALHAELWPLPEGDSLRVRLALHTGESEERDGDYFGAALSRTARLLSAAHGGQTLLSETLASLLPAVPAGGVSLRSLGRHRLKDLSQPQEIFQLTHPALPHEFPPLRSLESFIHNLPAQLSSFIGREEEVREARRMLGETRLLTLTGTGGAGKTRLALQAAAEVIEDFPDGVWLVDLAPLTDPELLPQAVAGVLGLGEEGGDRTLTATLTDALRLKSLLLVWDNCEHLVDACAHLAESLLRACPSLRLLATSREALEIGGEAVLPIPSLALPPGPPLPPTETLAGYESVRLFVDRATTALPAFRLSDGNAIAVAQV
ncbi:MAG: adenylate/guanylate cyclase domain-containing protein, partial [Pseudomonadota bacterium]|nr:adenylate/guanylate cyclase domain-containing protein [Pseudomonadota bacterium]